MGTRTMVCVQSYHNGNYDLFYRHNDGNPEALGFELVCFLSELNHEIEIGLTKDLTPEAFINRMVEKLKLQPEKRTVEKPEEAFLKVQGDLEYIYALRLESLFSRTRLDIYRTSNPYTETDFVFHLFGCYVMFAPRTIEEIAKRMDLIEATGNISLQAIAQYEKATEEAEEK